MELTRMTAAELAAALERNEVSATEVTRAHLDRIAAVDDRVHAFLHVAADSAATSRSLAAPTALRRSTSMARLRAAVVSQAPGRPGIPSRGQRCRAVAKASWAHSSARSQSPVTRMSVATTRPHSSRNAASTAALTSAA